MGEKNIISLKVAYYVKFVYFGNKMQKSLSNYGPHPFLSADIFIGPLSSKI